MRTTWKVLVVEDSTTDAKLIVQQLRSTGRTVEFERVDTLVAMRAALGAGGWDLVTCDWSMPRFSAPAALALVKELGLDIPFIIVSGTMGEEHAVAAMRAGAHDYVLKDKVGRLTVAVEREIREYATRKAHREAELRFSKLSDSGIIGIVVANIHGVVLDTNDTYLKMIGYTRGDLDRGEIRWDDLVAPEFRGVIAQQNALLVATGVAAPWEMEIVRKDGARVPILAGVAMLEYPKCISFTADLTERRRAEEARDHAEVALRESEGQLRQAQKMEAVGRLAGGVAHDFNNMLSVILTYGDLLLEQLKTSDPLHADVTEICKAGKRAAELTKRLLTFSRQQIVEPRVLDLNSVLDGADGMLRRMVGEDVDLVTRRGAGLGRVRADPSSVEQVIMNLVVNARDAMPTGGQLTIETANVVLDADYADTHVPATAGAYVMLAVSDTGCGMDKATQARIFEPFFTTKEIGKGTGLGLSMVFGIVQQSGGSVWVYSEVGKGTTFKVYLPRVDAAADAELQAQVPPNTLRGTETVLLVEDEEQVRTVVHGVLRRYGYQVLVAQHAGEALLLCERHAPPIHLLLTDVVMPQMSGPELARRLAKSRREMRVLCMSGYTDDSIVRHGVLDAGIAYMQKPLTPSTLLRKVREVLTSS